LVEILRDTLVRVVGRIPQLQLDTEDCAHLFPMQIGRRPYFGYTVAPLPFLIARLTPMLELSRKQMRVAQAVAVGARERLFI
jgi:hypothetical protein